MTEPAKKSERSSRPDLDYLKQIWLQEIASTHWIERKEISAWTALAFYLVGLSFVFKLFSEFKTQIEGYVIGIVILSLLCLAYIVFSFIQAQYSLSSFRRGYQSSVNLAMYFIVARKEIDFSLDEIKRPYPKELDELIRKAREREQPLHGAVHPLQITVSLFFNIPINWFRSKKRPELRPREKEEAAIYSSMLLANALLLYYFISKKWPQFHWACLMTIGVVLGFMVSFALYKEKRLRVKKKDTPKEPSSESPNR